jgi:hypothetical protein
MYIYHSTQRVTLNKNKNLANEYEMRIADLKAALEHEREENKKSLKMVEEEVKMIMTRAFKVLI